MCVGAKALFDGPLYLAGAGMGGGEGDAALHADMQFDGDAAADAAGAQVVRVVHIGEGRNDGQDVLLHLFGERGLHQFVDPLVQQFPCHAKDEKRDYQ